MGWFSNAYDNISDAVSNTAAQVAANITSGGVAVINFVASPLSDGDVVEKPDWVQTRMDKQNEVLADAIESVVSAKDTVVEATSSAIEWTVETGAPAVGNGAAWVVAATPVGYLARVAEAIGLGDPTGIADKHRQAEKAMIGFGKFVANDPLRAGAVFAQGASNAVTSTVGLVGDLGRNAIGLVGSIPGVATEYVLRPIGNAAYSIGQKEGDAPRFDNIDAFAALKYMNGGDSLNDAMKWTTAMNDITQFIEPIKGEYPADTREYITDDAGNTIDNPDYMKEFEIVEGEEVPSYVKSVENPNANYERAILYGTQAIVEVPVFLVATAATGGAAGPAFALKWGGKGLQTVNAMKRADLVADAIKLTDKAAKISSKTGKAVETSSKASKLTAKANEIATGERLGTKTNDITNWMKRKFPGVDDARQSMTQSDLMEYLAKDAEKLREAETKLDKLMSTGNATEKQILKQTKEIKAAEEALEKSRISVNQLASSSGNNLKEVSAEAARSATKTTEDLGMADRLKRGWEVGQYKTWHFVDPSRSPIADTAGVGLSFGMGVYADQKNAEAKQQSGFGIGAGEASRVLETGDRLRSDMAKDTSWYKKYDKKANLSQDFQETQPNKNDTQTDNLPGGSIDRNGQSGAFNNRANGLVTPIDTPAFKVEVPKEFADALLQTIRK